MGISAYSMIRMADGGIKRTEDIAESDIVLNPAGGELTIARVLNGPGIAMVGLADSNGNRLDATGDQPVMTETGFVPANQIRVGTRLRTAQGIAGCTEAGPLLGDFMVYDFAASAEAPSVFVNSFVIEIARKR